jgi:hypothetical protein
MSPTNKNYILRNLVEIKMKMNAPDIKLKMYNKTINVVFEKTTYEPHLTLNGERLDFDYTDDEDKEYVEYRFSRNYSRTNWIISENVFCKFFTNGSNPEFIISIQYRGIICPQSVTFLFLDEGIVDCRGFLYPKGDCLHKYNMNLRIE